MQIFSTLGLTLVSALTVSVHGLDYVASAFSASEGGGCTGELVASEIGDSQSPCISTRLPANCFVGIALNPTLLCVAAFHTDADCQTIAVGITVFKNNGISAPTEEFNYYNITCMAESTLPTSILIDPTQSPSPPR